MKRRRLAYFLLILALVVPLTVTAQDQDIPGSDTIGQARPETGQFRVAERGSAPEAPSPEGVLWDQPLSAIDWSTWVDQEFPDIPSYSSYLADDFVNAESWDISNIFVPGNGWNGFTTLFNASSLTWQIYADGGGVPAGDPSSGGAFWTLTLPPTDPDVTITTGSGGYPSNVSLDMAVPVTLPPGDWWFVFYPTMAFTGLGQYGRQGSDTTNGYTGQFINPGGGFGLGTDWQPWTVLGTIIPPPPHDQAFRLEGTLTPPPCEWQEVYWEDFEGGFGDWTMDGLWNEEHETDTCGSQVAPFPSSDSAAWYGIDGICTYDNASHNSGSLAMAFDIDLSDAEEAQVVFQSFEETECDGGCSYDHRFVEYSLDGGSTWLYLGEAYTEDVWYEWSAGLTPAAGGPVRVRFHFDTMDEYGNNYFGWMVDNVQVNACLPPPDIRVEPGALHAVQCPDTIKEQALHICNDGPGTLEWALGEVAGPMALAGPMPFVAVRDTPGKAPRAPAPGTTGSRGASVDTAEPIQYVSLASFSEGFDNITLLPGQGWFFQNNSDPLGTTGWFQGDSLVFPAHAGAPAAYIAANFNNTGSVGTISNWMLTPEISLNDGDTISFWTRTPSGSIWPDRLELRLSTAGASTDVGSTADSVGDFATLLLSVNPTLAVGGYPEVWTQFTATLSGIPGGATGRLGFRYYVTDAGGSSANSNYIGIDTVEYGSAGGSDIPWLSEDPTAGSLVPGGCQDVAVAFDSTGLAPDEYFGGLEIASNDPDQPLVTVPVQLTVASCTGDPDIEVTPESLSASQCPGEVTGQPLAICSQGDAPIEWTLTELAAPPKGTQAVLWDNGPLVTYPGACTGQDASRVQTGLGMTTLGFGHQYTLGYRMADDFQVTDPAGWQVNQITFFAYQTGAPTSPSPITGLYFQIWDGPPNDAGSSVVFGDLVTNRLASTIFTDIQRDTETIPCANDRYIFADVGTAGVFLSPGTYWLDWSTDGNLTSGPWAPPITVLGETTTGNAMQYTTAWLPAVDTGSGTQQGMPFVIEGTPAGPDVPWLSEDPTSGTILQGTCQEVAVTFDSTGLAPGGYSAILAIDSNDPDEPQVTVPVGLEVINCSVGNLEGHVYDANTGLGIPDAYVLIEYPDGSTYFETHTDTAGFYVFDDVPMGPVTATYAAYGYTTQYPVELEILPAATTVHDVELTASDPAWSPPGGMLVELLPDGATTEILSIDNEGTADLEFHLSEVPDDAGYPMAAIDAPAMPSGVDPQVYADLEASSDGTATFLVYMAEQADLSAAYQIADWSARGQYVLDALRATAETSQAGLQAALEEAGTSYQSHYIINALVVEGDANLVDSLASRPDVGYIGANLAIEAPEPVEMGAAVDGVDAVVWNIAQVNADDVWSTFGVTGEGITVANIDTGVYYEHPALNNQYRGNLGGSYDHNYNWWDPYGYGPSEPYDWHDHGSHTMGTMLGDDGGDNQIGMAPGASWFACQGFDQATGYGYTSELMECGAFVLAPWDLSGANPDPDMRADVVNNSWGGGQAQWWYNQIIYAWRAAGIFPAFSIGNNGALGCESAGDPGDMANVIAAGATDISDNITSFSGRGPAAITGILKPNVTAPGSGVISAYNDGTYGPMSGTSMASPHVAGEAALIWSAVPELRGNVQLTQWVIEQSAMGIADAQCGDPGPPNNVYGWGRIDALEAVSMADAGSWDIPWLSIAPEGGTVGPDGSVDVEFHFDATGLAVGCHTGNVKVEFNDPYVTELFYPVELCVVPPCEPVEGFDFDWLPESPFAGETVSFSATEPDSGTPPFTYLWDFGDGFGDVGMDVNHSYTAAGEYEVVLQVENACSAPTLAKMLTVAEEEVDEYYSYLPLIIRDR